MKIATSLAVLTGSLPLATVLIGGVGLYGIQASNDSLKTVYEDRTVPAADLGFVEVAAGARYLAGRSCQAAREFKSLTGASVVRVKWRLLPPGWVGLKRLG